MKTRPGEDFLQRAPAGHRAPLCGTSTGKTRRLRRGQGPARRPRPLQTRAGQAWTATLGEQAPQNQGAPSSPEGSGASSQATHRKPVILPFSDRTIYLLKYLPFSPPHPHPAASSSWLPAATGVLTEGPGATLQGTGPHGVGGQRLGPSAAVCHRAAAGSLQRRRGVQGRPHGPSAQGCRGAAVRLQGVWFPQGRPAATPSARERGPGRAREEE